MELSKLIHSEKAMAPHSSTLAWKMPWTEEPGGLQSMGSLGVGHDWATSLSLFTHALEKEMATHSSVLAWRIPGKEELGGLLSMGLQSRTQLKWLSSSSSSRQHIKKQRHYFANKDPSSQSYGFSSSHVWMWELDCKESWEPKNWCFWTVVLEKTLESPLDRKEIKPVHPKGNQSWIFIGRTDSEAETPILWPPDVKSWLIGKDTDAGKDWR